ncbi:fibroblast growth factor receptor 1-like isoform X2 [Corticium candelabrum]|uniref:fibroblast growth factor receptor 1-like isoform X2 n=1 Tax=Corticium candelabrum TaxID=121492 RepID=UPI002E2613D5|nr:fibroblast growth factor receptor 1-like isoform X2 [Corticium candelabrum]
MLQPLVLLTLLAHRTSTAPLQSAITPTASPADVATILDVQQTSNVSSWSQFPTQAASHVTLNNALHVTPSTDSTSSSGSESVLSKIIMISVPSLTGLLLLAIGVFIVFRVRSYVAARRLVDDALSCRSSVLPHVVLPEPMHQAFTSYKGEGNRCSEGSDLFPDNYRYLYGGSQPSENSSEVSLQKVMLLEEIGSGCFSKVYLAILSTKTRDTDSALQVAVKLLKISEVPATARQEMIAETEIFRTLGYCPYIVNMLGGGKKGDNMYVITEYADLGNLKDYLQSECENTLSSHQLSSDCEENTTGLSELDLIGFAEQIIYGMEHIARNGVIHGDLASRNILVFSTNLVKISDFGLAHYVSQNGPGERLRGSTLPVRWMPPEGIFRREYSLKSDVWAFGVLLWEIVTLGSTPYPEFTDSRLMKKLRKGYRMPRPPSCSNQLYHVMRGCWHNHPKDRPTFTDLRELVAHLLGECRRSNEPTHIDYIRLKSHTHHTHAYEHHTHAYEHKLMISSDDERYSDVFTGAWTSTDSDSSYKKSSGKLMKSNCLDRASHLDAQSSMFLTDNLISSTQHLTDCEIRSDDTE